MIRGRTVALTLAIGLMLAVPSVWADQNKEPADDSPSEVAWVWFDTLYDVVKSEATAPPPVARIYGVAAVALYEAVVPGALHHRSLVGRLNGLVSVPQPKKHGKYHWPTVANATLGRTIRGLFPSLKPESLEAVYALEQSFAAQFHTEVKPQDYLRSVAHGQAVADAILAWAAAVLTAMFGIKAFTDTTHVDHHLMPLQEPRSFSSFDEAAQEAAASRLYGGIHFPFDNDDGLASGHCIGQAIIDRVRFRDEDND